MNTRQLATFFQLPPSFFEGARPVAGGGEAASVAAADAAAAAAAAMVAASEAGVPGDAPAADAPPPPSTSAGEGLTCRACRIGTPGSPHPPFTSVHAQRAHVRSDAHRLNVRRVAAGKAPLAEADAEQALEGRRGGDGGGGGRGGGASDVSSLSGSDSEDSEEEEEEGGGRAPPLGATVSRGGGVASTSTSGPLVAFAAPPGAAAPFFAVWRALLPAGSGAAENVASPSAALAALRTDAAPWAVILAKGGHFAAAAFDVSGGEAGADGPSPSATHAAPLLTPLAHRTAHRYVVRAKAGGRQSTKDAGGKTIKSAGSTLRRYNEAALDAEIKATLAEWGDLLGRAGRIFVHAPGVANAGSIFAGSGGGSGGGDGRLDRKDPRVRGVPFPVRRPTFSEARRVVRALLTVFAVPEPPPVEEVRVPASAPPSQPAPPPPRPPAAPAGKGTAHLKAAAQPVPAQPPPPAVADPPIHAASKAGDAEAVAALLDADPALALLRDAAGRPPYAVAADRPTRDAFRCAAGSAPGAVDWLSPAGGGIPSALTPELEACQAAKAADKKAKARAAEKERKAAVAAKKEAAAAAEAAALEAATAAAAAMALGQARGKGPAAAGKQVRSAGSDARRAQLAAAAEARLRAAAAAQRLN